LVISGHDFTEPRNPGVTTMTFLRHARKIGFNCARFHDLRGAHETMLLDNGVPVHVVTARCGHDPAVLLRAMADIEVHPPDVRFTPGSGHRSGSA